MACAEVITVRSSGHPASQRKELDDQGTDLRFEISGKRGINAMKFRKVRIDNSYTQFEDEPKFADVAKIADRLMDDFVAGRMDRLDVVYTKFQSISKQVAVVETLLAFHPTQTGVG